MDETKAPIPIFMHRYNISKMSGDKMGLRQIVIYVQTETRENEHFSVVEQAIKMLDGENLNVEHTIVLEGYKENV